MHVLRSTLMILSVSGCWQPFSYKSLTKYLLYNVYSLLLINILCSFGLSQLIELVSNVNNPDDFTSLVYTMLCAFVTGYKALDLWVNHENFVTLIKNLTKGSFKALMPAEIEIRRRFDKMIHIITICYAIMAALSFVGIVLVSLLTDFRRRKLLLREWLPYDYSSFMKFCITYIYQYSMLMSSCLVNVAFDSLFIGVLLHLCCQLTILKYRLRNITNDQNSLRNCVLHHHHIIQYAHITNARFTKVIGFQFVASTFTICSNLYQITRIKLWTSQLFITAYTCCILFQIFIYSWFGNKLKLMSLQVIDSIFEMDWVTLDNRIKKSLLIIMNRAMMPIEFVSASMLKMNLDSFVALFKTSYTIYNLLMQMQDQ